MLSEGDTARHLEYDCADRLRAFFVQTGTAEPSKYTHYLYDGSGNRVKKITRTQGGDYTATTNIDGAFEYTKESSSGDEQNILNIMGGATRRIGDALGDSTPAIKYNLSDHLGSSCVQLDTNGTTVSLEEYYPFGETSFGSYAKKRYRFCGKEKDEESGLYYYGMRYYSPWTCRFISIDPLAFQSPNKTPYHYCSNDPINRTDPTGMSDEDPKAASGGGGGGGGQPATTNFNIHGLSSAGVPITEGKPNTQGTDINGDNITDLHKTQDGENYGSIAKKYGVSVDNLRAWNGFADKSVPAGHDLIVSQEGYNNAHPHAATASTTNTESSQYSVLEGIYHGTTDAANSRIDWMQRFKTSEGRSQNWSGFKSSAYTTLETFTWWGFEKNIQTPIIDYFSSIPEKSGGELAYGAASFGYNAVNSTSDGMIVSGGATFVPAYLKGTFTTSEGFAFGSINFNKGLPFNINVKRFGSPTGGFSTIAPKAFGTEGFGRIGLAIKHEWTPGSLGSFNSYTLPKGTSFKIGLAGPQGFKYPGGYLQIKSGTSTLRKN